MSFVRHKRGFVDYRCHHCQRTYNLYTGTLFAGSNLEPRRVVLLVRGVCKGEPATVLAEELALSRQCVIGGGNDSKPTATHVKSRRPCGITRRKPMRCSRTRGKKGDKHGDPCDPPRRRANKRRGHGTYENDRPPIVGTVGRESGQCRLRVRQHTDGKTLQTHVHGYTKKDTTCYTDEWQGYNQINVVPPHGVSRPERMGAR